MRLCRTGLLALIFVSSVATNANGAESETCFSSVEEWVSWVMGYHLSPSPEKVPCSFSFYAQVKDENLDKKRWSALRFYAALLNGNGKLREEFFGLAAASNSREIQVLATGTFWVMNSPAGRKLLQRVAAEWTSTPAGGMAVLLLDAPPSDALGKKLVTVKDAIEAADALDGLWYAYFATGESLHLERLVNVLPRLASDDKLENAIGKAASWSLTSNARQFDSVRMALVKIGKTTEEPAKRLLWEILMDSEPKTAVVTPASPGSRVPWDASEGDFEVSVVFTDKPRQFFAAWERPGKGVPISSTTHGVRGHPVVAVVLFKGCAKDRSGMCNLSVDFEFAKPDGSVYAGQKGVELWVKKPPPAEGLIELGTGYIGVVFEPEDPVGVYVLRTVVHDRNSGIDLEISNPLELRE